MKKSALTKSRKKVIGITALIISVIMLFCSIPKSQADEAFGYIEFTIDLNSLKPGAPLKLSGGKFEKTYYDQLNKVEKEIYKGRLQSVDRIRDGEIERVEFKIKTEVTVNDFISACHNAVAAYDYDHPEFFWVSRVFRVGARYNTDTGIVVTGAFVKPETGWYISDYQDESEIVEAESAFNSQVKKLVSQAKGSAYDKALYFHDWLVNNNSYNSFVIEGDPDRAYESAWYASSALIGDPDKKEDDPVCEGYARAFKVLCDKAGVPCVIAVGDAQGPHMWNYVKMHNGLWFAVDVTWDDPVSDTPQLTHDNFLKGSKTFFKRHTQDGNFIGYGTFSYPSLCERDYPQALGGNLGDISDNDMIDSGDATLLLRSLVGLYIIPEERVPYADMNLNGKTDAGDATLILRYVVGSE